MATELFKQARIRRWLGAFQVQVTNTMFYVSLINTTMLAITFWYTSGSLLAARYAPGLKFWMFALVMLGFLLLIMWIDYKWIYPSRQAFLNDQSCKHDNPAMDSLARIEDALKRIEELKKNA